jgi:predicted membrane metal-binding protein
MLADSEVTMPLPIILFLAKLKAILFAIGAFVIKHWRVFLPLLIVGAILLCIHTLREQRDDARKALATYQADIVKAKEKRAAANLLKEQQAQLDRDKEQSKHQSQIATLRRQYEAEHQGRQFEKAGSDRRDDLWRERVRLEIANATTRLPDVPETAGVPAQGGGERYTADPGQARERYINTLEIGCAVTTADYNACMSSWSRACEIYGCK